MAPDQVSHEGLARQLELGTGPPLEPEAEGVRKIDRGGTRAESWSTLTCPSERDGGRHAEAAAEVPDHAQLETPTPAYDTSARLGGQLDSCVSAKARRSLRRSEPVMTWKAPPKIQVVVQPVRAGEAEVAEAAAGREGVAHGHEARPRSTMVSAVASVKSRLV